MRQAVAFDGIAATAETRLEPARVLQRSAFSAAYGLSDRAHSLSRSESELVEDGSNRIMAGRLKAVDTMA